MLEIIQALGSVIDYPVTVSAFVWALRMIKVMYDDMQELLERCLDKQ